MLFQAALLGIVQGLTEFLPISSSAHLILARAFFGWNTEQFGVAFDVACHVGTLLAVVVYFGPELANMVRALPRAFRPAGDASARQIWLLAAGTVPIVPAGLLFSGLEDATRTPVVAGTMLAVGGALLWIADRMGSRTRAEDSLTMFEAVGLGLAQAAALVPGVSRSGATMTLALLLGLRRDAAARFSFLLGIPAMLAAAGYESLVVVREGLPTGAATLFAVGAITAGIVGFLAVKYFLRYVAGHSLTAFAWYRFALAAAVAWWVLAR
jgi:undecaprenyl-diphosphatase